MAEQLNMGGLNLNGGGENGSAGGAAPLKSYIPPHMRGKMGGPQPANPPPAPPAAGGLANSAWAAPAA